MFEFERNWDHSAHCVKVFKSITLLYREEKHAQCTNMSFFIQS